jgi:hypothetical protein
MSLAEGCVESNIKLILKSAAFQNVALFGFQSRAISSPVSFQVADLRIDLEENILCFQTH